MGKWDGNFRSAMAAKCGPPRPGDIINYRGKGRLWGTKPKSSRRSLSGDRAKQDVCGHVLHR